MEEMEKYKQFFEDFDEFTKKKYKRFFETFMLYTFEKLNTSRAKSKRKDIGRYTRTFRFLLENIDKDLDSMTEEELYQILLDQNSKSDHRRVLSRYYHFLGENSLFAFHNSLSCFQEASSKTEQSFYTLEEWSQFANMVLDIDAVLPRALENVNVARCWLYLMLHLCVAWRRGDILSLPAMDNLLGIEKYTRNGLGTTHSLWKMKDMSSIM